jgi:hypothetical protein
MIQPATWPRAITFPIPGMKTADFDDFTSFLITFFPRADQQGRIIDKDDEGVLFAELRKYSLGQESRSKLLFDRQ